MAKARLHVELLESRTTPAAIGFPWPEAGSLTLSFAPDGTQAGNQTDRLYQTLGNLPTTRWQTEILRAFQTWVIQTNVNVGLVPDGGQPFGILGLKQGDPRFGDVRIGALPMGSDTVAVADPYDPFVANTWVGDVFLNSTQSFTLGAQGDGFDVSSVMLHEAGHVLGLGHSGDPNSPMYEHFHPKTASLTPADVRALQGLYGSRAADAFEGRAGNEDPASATVLSLLDPAGLPSETQVAADLTTGADVDFYKIVVPAGAQSLDVTVQASGISLLVPHLTLLDASGTAVSSAAAESPLSNDLRLHLDQPSTGAVYYVKVEAATGDVFAIGSYHLTVAPRHNQAAGAAALVALMNSAPTVPVQLLATTPGYVEHTYYEIEDRFDAVTPEHVYQVNSANLGPGVTNVMTVLIQADDPRVQPQVTVVDDQGHELSTSVVVSADGILEVQVPSVLPNRDYFVHVGATSPGTEQDVVIDFAQDVSELATLVSDTLASSDYQLRRTLMVRASQQFHLVLSAAALGGLTPAGVRMTIVDPEGVAVFTLVAPDGATRTGDVFLNAGTYTVQLVRAGEHAFVPPGPPSTRYHDYKTAAGTRAPLLIELRGTGVSEPIGPQLRDTTDQPLEPPASVPPPSFFWLPFQSAQTRAAAPPGSSSPMPATPLLPVAPAVGAATAPFALPAASVFPFQPAASMSLAPPGRTDDGMLAHVQATTTEDLTPLTSPSNARASAEAMHAFLIQPSLPQQNHVPLRGETNAPAFFTDTSVEQEVDPAAETSSEDRTTEQRGGYFAWTAALVGIVAVGAIYRSLSFTQKCKRREKAVRLHEVASMPCQPPAGLD